MAGSTTIAVVTPSFNQGQFLNDALESVIGQQYPALEYVVVDGGSTDESPAVIERHSGSLAYWVSEPDDGQYDAINKGFARTSGEIMAWLNSDDMYTPWAFSVVADIFERFPEVEWITSLFPLRWDERGRAVRCTARNGFSRRGFFRGEHLPGAGWYAESFIQQESTFWRRSLWERAGGFIDASFKLAGDFDLWARFFQHAELYGVGTPLAGFRVHSQQKTANYMDTYLEEAKASLRRHGGRPYREWESRVHRRLRKTWPRRLDRLATKLRVRPADRMALHATGGGWKILRT